MGVGGAEDTSEWCASEREQTLLLLPRTAEEQSEQSSSHRSSRRRLAVPGSVALSPTAADSSGADEWPTQLLSAIRSSARACRRFVVPRLRWVVALLAATLLSSALLAVLPCLVADPHARWQLLAARLISAQTLLMAVQAELRWDATFLLLGRGSRLRACQADSPSFGPLVHFSDALVSDSSDGLSYDVSGAPPWTFAPSYRSPVSGSSVYPPARVVACSSPSMRCDAAFADVFQAELVAEMDAAARTPSTRPFCTAPADDPNSCQQWPFPDSGDGSAVEQGGGAGCGSGVLGLSESRHWWYYQHPMSCMRLARSIGARHGYCAGREPQVDEAVVLFHLTMFGPVWRRQATLAVESFLVSQNLSQSRLLIWTDRPWSELNGVADMRSVLAAFPAHVSVRVVDLHAELLRSRSLLSASAAWYASIDDSLGYLRGDLLRLLLLHNYGGVYFDADVLLLRDFAPFLGQQFLYKWGGHCDELNGAVARLFKGSKLGRRMLDSLYHTPPRSNTVAWGNSLYTRLHAEQRASLAEPTAASLRSEHFTVLPACFFNPNWMVPEAFSPLLRPELPRLWPGMWLGPFAFHLHGEVWDEAGFAARDPSYRHAAARIAQRMAAMRPMDAAGGHNATAGADEAAARR